MINEIFYTGTINAVGYNRSGGETGMKKRNIKYTTTIK